MNDNTNAQPAQSHAGEPQKASRKPKKWMLLLIIVIVLLLLALAGWLAWQLKQCRDQHTKDKNTNQTLQSKVDSLTKQVQQAKASSSSGSSSSTSSTATTPTCSGATLTADLKGNISDAISSKNTAALEGYMASSVTYVLAASEKGGAETPAQAVADLEYVNSNATAPWDFNLSTATINSYKAGFYSQYFDGTIHVGKSANNYVISFGFDDCSKINRIFVALVDTL